MVSYYIKENVLSVMYFDGVKAPGCHPITSKEKFPVFYILMEENVPRCILLHQKKRSWCSIIKLRERFSVLLDYITRNVLSVILFC